MIESLYAKGKFKSTQVEHEYLASDELQSIIKAAVQDDVLKRGIAGDERIKASVLARLLRKDTFNKII